MKKSNRKELNWEQTEKLVTMALEEKNPFEIIKHCRKNLNKITGNAVYKNEIDLYLQ